jgi:antitoxin component HigA of HigAB toxin-antitoxin module
MTAGEVRPILSEADYEAALAEIEQLWGAKAGTLAGDRLDVLATLVDAYEAEQYPMDPPDPIEAIQFRMEQQGLTTNTPHRPASRKARTGRRSTRWIRYRLLPYPGTDLAHSSRQDRSEVSD